MPKKNQKNVAVKAIAKTEITETKETPVIRKNTKMSQLIESIQNAEDGLTLKQISETLKWQPHTVRSVLSRLNKVYNIGVTSHKSGKSDRTYKIAKKD